MFVGLAGILVCAMLGGMKAVTWTQVAQYIVLIIAYMTPVVWLGVRHTGIPVPQVAYGYTLQKLGDVEKKITADPKEIEVRKIFADRAAAGKARETFRAAVLSADGLALSGVIHDHPFFGPLNVYQWVELIAAHEMRHVAQVREAAAQLTARV